MVEETRASRLSPLPATESLAEGAYQSIRRAILAGHFTPGDRLSVPDIAGQLGISRSPTREAVLRLEREGLAISFPNRGAVVAPANSVELRDLYDVRELLEGLVARKAAERRTDRDREDLTHLWRKHESVVESGDLEQHIATDLEFHSRLAQTSRNRRAIEMLARLSDQIRLGLQSTSAYPGNPDQALTEHRSILEAVLAGNPSEAELAARRHIARVKQSLPDSRQSKDRAEETDDQPD